VPILFGTIAKW